MVAVVAISMLHALVRIEAVVVVAVSSHVTIGRLHKALKEVVAEAIHQGSILLHMQALMLKEAVAQPRDVVTAMVAVLQEEAAMTLMQNTVQRSAWHTKRLQ